jgi:hypothetical protein
MSDTDNKVGRVAQLVEVRVQVADDADKEQEEGAVDDANTNQRLAAEQAAPAKRDANFGEGDDHLTEEAVPGDTAELIAARTDEDKDDDTVDDDTNEEGDGDIESLPEIQDQKNDMSLYDTWMGVLSSTSLQYFVRIVPSSAAGVVVLDDFE